VRREGDLVVIGLCGEHDLGTQSQLSAMLARFCGAGSAGDVVVDLSEATFVDSSTISVLLDGLDLMQDQGRNLIVREPSLQAYRVLEIAGLLDVFAPMYSGSVHPGAQATPPANTVEMSALREAESGTAPAEDTSRSR
jgi:anti-sigma B factor antagonist